MWIRQPQSAGSDQVSRFMTDTNFTNLPPYYVNHCFIFSGCYWKSLMRHMWEFRPLDCKWNCQQTGGRVLCTPILQKRATNMFYNAFQIEQMSEFTSKTLPLLDERHHVQVLITIMTAYHKLLDRVTSFLLLFFQSLVSTLLSNGSGLVACPVPESSHTSLLLYLHHVRDQLAEKTFI